MVPRKVTMTYAEFDQFWVEVLGDDWCMDDDDTPDSFWEGTDPHRTATITCASILWQRSGRYPEPSGWYTQRELDHGLDFFALVARWRAKQQVVTAVAEIPADKVDEWREFIAGVGGETVAPVRGDGVTR